MSYGLHLPGNGTEFFIDQDYPGHFLGSGSYAYLPPQSTVHTAQVPGHVSGDLVFCRPDPASSSPFAGLVSMLNDGTVFSASHTQLYGSLANHPHAVSGYGVVVYTPSGKQAFNSTAHHKRLEIAASGTIASSSGSSARASVVFSPSDSISNYYCLANTARIMGVTVYISLYPEMTTTGYIGTQYRYNFSANTITFEPDLPGPSGMGAVPMPLINKRQLYYCIAKITG